MIKSDLVSKINPYGDVVLSEDAVVEALLTGTSIDGVRVDDDNAIAKFEQSVKTIDVEGLPSLYAVKKYDMEPEKHLVRRSMTWNIPSEYLYMDIIEYLIRLCKTPEEVKRVEEEILEFHKRDELNILRVMKYIVDSFRENNVVWGVGRGSSVSCFCLYLIGINKINPLKYDIPYTEYFKEKEKS